VHGPGCPALRIRQLDRKNACLASVPDTGQSGARLSGDCEKVVPQSHAPLRSTAQSLDADGDRRALAPGGNVALPPWFGVTSATRLITPFRAKSALSTAETTIAIICNPRSSA